MRAADRLTRVLRAVAIRSPVGVTLTELAALCALNKATALRLSRALCATGWLTRSDTDGRYTLGTEAWLAGRQAVPVLNRLADLAAPRLRMLSRRTGDTIYLAVRSGLEVVCVLRVVGAEPVSATMTIGQRHSLAVGASGLALLASLTDADFVSVLASLAQPRDRPAERRALETEVLAARQRGFAISRGSYFYGVPAIGVAIRDRAGVPIVAVSLAASAARLTDAYIRDVAPHLLRTAASLQRALQAEAEKFVSVAETISPSHPRPLRKDAR